ncbi:hypothetical protein AMATHDRAFT_8444 [Amanita thiersii Skay4041]|uniref:Uncharacterized protein n=1 Tax=Amanita thiersii Skay4041 TaxID=703135 RepID=A0A2A9NCG6_9AGAR|nr:hypothetical protein AMATHDRAFT_8444 [Amanita thiersii Skay4041]
MADIGMNNLADKDLHLMTQPGTGISLVFVLAHPEEGGSVFKGSQAITVKLFFSMTFATNGLSLIAFKLWVTQRELVDALRNSQKRPISLNRIWIIILESGSIYWATLLVMLALYESPVGVAALIFLDITSPIIGMVFALIIVRVSLGFKPDGTRGEMASSILFSSRAHRRSHGIITEPGTVELPCPASHGLASRAPLSTVDSDSLNDLKKADEHIGGLNMQVSFPLDEDRHQIIYGQLDKDLPRAV